MDWECCTSDILLYIFKHLDLKSLINCMLVNKLWKDTVDYYCEHYRLWRKLVEESIPNQGVTFQQKSNLDFRDVILNFLLWQNVKNASISIRRHQIENLKSINRILVVCDEEVSYYNAKTFNLEKSLNESPITYNETDAIIVEIEKAEQNISRGKFILRNKLHYARCCCTPDRYLTASDVLMYKLQSNHCYVLDTKSIIWLYKFSHCSCDVTVVAKYHGQPGLISCLHVHDSEVYILLKNGVIMHVDAESRMFENISHIDVPFNYVNVKSHMFHRHSVVFNVENDYRCRCYPQDKEVVLTCSGLTSTMEHGDILFLGYEDGLVQIFIISKLLENIIEPELEIDIKKWADNDNGGLYSVLESRPNILAIEIFEDVGEHHLFFATTYHIYQVLLK